MIEKMVDRHAYTPTSRIAYLFKVRRAYCSPNRIQYQLQKQQHGNFVYESAVGYALNSDQAKGEGDTPYMNIWFFLFKCLKSKQS